MLMKWVQAICAGRIVVEICARRPSRIIGGSVGRPVREGEWSLGKGSRRHLSSFFLWKHTLNYGYRFWEGQNSCNQTDVHVCASLCGNGILPEFCSSRCRSDRSVARTTFMDHGPSWGRKPWKVGDFWEVNPLFRHPCQESSLVLKALCFLRKPHLQRTAGTATKILCFVSGSGNSCRSFDMKRKSSEDESLWEVFWALFSVRYGAVFDVGKREEISAWNTLRCSYQVSHYFRDFRLYLMWSPSQSSAVLHIAVFVKRSRWVICCWWHKNAKNKHCCCFTNVTSQMNQVTRPVNQRVGRAAIQRPQGLLSVALP